MIYLFETELKNSKNFQYSLNKIYGINKKTSLLICNILGISYNLKVQNLSKKQVNIFINLLEKSEILVGTDLIKYRTNKIKTQVQIKLLKGLRRRQGLPIRGQRTHTNAKTAKKRIIL
uniref:Ribosomal protein S13 n=1 Tax=Trieres regia TaxID=1335017 RepID=A0A7T4WR71_9STRA|nr:ribosomal protein S13 [Odontella regia]QQD79288.1 ribosomal protein S13 [Odontella regia]